MRLNNKGFGAIEIVLIVVIVGILGFVGYRAYTIYTDDPETGAEQSGYEFEDKEKEEKTKPEVTRTELGSYSFVFPEEWKDLSKETPDDDAIAVYSFNAGSDTQINGVKISNGEIGLYRLSDINVDKGSDKLQKYSSSEKSWNEITKKPLNNFTGIVADYFGDGLDGEYSLVIQYFLIKGDKAVVISLSESGKGNGTADQYSFSSTSSKSNKFQKQVVSLLNSVK